MENGLGLVVPELEEIEKAKEEEVQSQVKEDVAEEKNDKTEEKEETVFSDSNDDIEIDTETGEVFDKHLISKSTEEQINKKVIRTVYVDEQTTLNFPCIIIDFSNASGITMDLLIALKNCVTDEKELYIQYNSEEKVNEILDTLDTYVYTKSATKITLIGRINKAESGYIIQKLIESAKLDGEYYIYHGENGKLRKAKGKQSDYRNVRLRL